MPLDDTSLYSENTPKSNWADDPSLYEVSSSPPETNTPLWSDHPNYLANVYHNARAGWMQLTGQPDAASNERAKAADAFNDMSPGGRAAASGWNKNYLHGALFGIESQFPAVAAAIAGGAVAGGPGAALGFGGVSAADFHNAAASTIEQMPPDKLQELHPQFNTYSTYMSDSDARQQIIADERDKINKGAAVAGVAGVVAGAVPMVGGPVASAATGAATSAITDLALGAVTGEPQSASEVAGHALENAALFGGLSLLGGHHDVGRTTTKAADTAGAGASETSGAAEARVSHPRADETVRARGGLDSDATPGQSGTSVGGGPLSAEKQSEKPRDTPSQPGGSGPAPAPDPKDPDIDAALKAAQPITPGVSKPEPTTAPPVEQPAPAPEPAPSPAVRPPTDIPIPERPKSLQLQQQAVVEGEKKAILYPDGEGVLPLPKELKQVKVGSDVVQYDPDKVNKAQILTAFKQDKLNELLDLGPLSKTEVQAKVTPDNPAIALVERTRDGTPVKDVAATEQTAPQQMPALEQTKLSPENEVRKENVAPVIHERQGAPRILPDISDEGKLGTKLARLGGAEQAKKIKKEITPGVKEPTGKHWTKEELTKQSDRNLAADKIMTDHEPMQREGVTDIYKRAERMVTAAKNIPIPTKLASHHSAGMMLLSEAKALISEKTPGPGAYARFQDREALLRAGKKDEVLSIRKAEGAKELGAPTIHDVAETTEHAEADEEAEDQAGREEHKLKEREELKKAYPTTGEKAAPKFQVETKREGLSRLRERLAERAKKPEPTEAQLKAGNYEKPLFRSEGHEGRIETGKGEVRHPYETPMPVDYGYERRTMGKDGDNIDVFLGPHGDTGKIFVMNQNKNGVFDEHKVFKGFKDKEAAAQAYIKSFDDPAAQIKNIGGVVQLTRDEYNTWLEEGDKFQPISTGLEGENPLHVIETGTTGGRMIKTQYLKRSTFSEASKFIDYSHYSESMRPAMKALVNKLNSLIGDIPVYGFSGEEMDRINEHRGNTLNGFYNPAINHIGMNVDMPTNMMSHVLIHEAVHAATVHALNTVKPLADLAQRLYNEVKESHYGIRFAPPKELRYGLTSPKEMLTELMSNPALQELMKKIPISAELARDLDMPRWRRATLYQGALDWFRKMLGLSPREYNVVEAAFNIGERAMWAKEPADEYAYRLRASQVSKGDMGIEAMLSPRDYSKSIKDSYKAIDDKVEKFSRGTSPTINATRIHLERLFKSPDEMVRSTENLLNLPINNPFRKWLDSMSAKDAEVRNTLKVSEPLMRKYVQLSVNDPEEFNKLSDVLVSSAKNGAHPDYELGVGKNSHIKPNKPAMQYRDAIQNHADDRKNYQALTPESKDLFGRIRNEMEQEHKDVLDMHRKQLTDAIEKELRSSDFPAEFKEALRKTINREELTTKENKAYGKDKNIKLIRNFDKTSKQSQKGPYFPTRQEGNYVITGEHNYEVPKGAVRDKENPNRILFDNEKDAWAFKAKDSAGDTLSTEMRSRTYWPQEDGGKIYTKPDDVRTTPDWRGKTTPEKEYQITVNPKHIEFADSMAEGERYRRAMMDHAGIKNDSISQVLPKKQEPWAYGAEAPDIKSMLDHVEKMPHLSDSTKASATDAIKYAGIAGMKGNSLAKSYLKSYRTSSNIDSIRSLDMRRRANASALAMAKHMPDVRNALDEMETYSKSNLNHPYAADLRTAIEMFKDRSLHYQTDALSNLKTSRFWNGVATFGLYKYLLSPAFLVRHQIHVPLFVLPRLAKDVGTWQAVKMTTKIYRDMAGGWPVIGRGVGSGLKIIWDYDHKPIDFIDALKAERLKRGGTTEEMRMIDMLSNWDIMHHTGIDFTTAYKGTGALDRVNRSARDLSQEIIGSADAVSRFNSALMFYRAGRDIMHLSHDDATRMAADRIRETQGQYSSFNRVEFMRNAGMRSVMQFKSFPLLVLKTITKAMYNSLRYEASMTERLQGLQTLGGITAAAMAISGVSGAIPEPLEDLIDVASLLGLGPNWPTIEDKLRMAAADEFTPEGATLLMDGLGGIAGVDLHHVGGISDITGLPYLLTGKQTGEPIYKWLAGVPGSIMGDAFTGMGDLQGGNWEQGLQMLLPKVITDPIKAYQEYTQGVETRSGKIISGPVSAPEAFLRAIGFVTTAESHARQARYITGQELAAKQAAKPKKIGGQTILGYKPTPKDLQEIKERARAYGIQ